jgi:acetyltransferase-like isoleucine patch superfamily enzyme
MVLPVVIIGEYSVIAASSVATKSIPDKTISRGIPAKPLRDIKGIVESWA